MDGSCFLMLVWVEGYSSVEELRGHAPCIGKKTKYVTNLTNVIPSGRRRKLYSASPDPPRWRKAEV